MEITEKNCKIADKIVKILEEESCTVEEAKRILVAVSKDIEKNSTVQIKKTFMKRFINDF